MSLARHADAIASAVAGELSQADEAVLREHLRGCAECRARYDDLSLAARALRGKDSVAEARRAEERLLAALEPPAAPQPRRRSSLWWALGIPAAVAALMAVLTTLVPPPGEDVTLRGAPEIDAGARGFFVQIFAKPRDGGALRLAAELPGSGEARVSASDWLQVKFHPNPRGTRFFAVDERGTPTALSDEVSRALPPGRYQLWGLHDLSMTEAQAIEDAPLPWPNGALPVRLSERAHVAQGRLQVDP